jgi:hypothetical protein
MAPVIPFVEAGVAIFSAIEGVTQANKAQASAAAATQNQSANLAQVGSLAQQEAQGPSFQSLLDAQKGGIASLKAQDGGIANEGALIKNLYGQNIENALGASISQRDANLNGAGNLLLGAGSQYGGQAATAAGATQNPSSGISSAVFSVLNAFGRKPGAGSGGDIATSPAGGATTGTFDTPPPTPSNFG